MKLTNELERWSTFYGMTYAGDAGWGSLMFAPMIRVGLAQVRPNYLEFYIVGQIHHYVNVNFHWSYATIPVL